MKAKQSGAATRTDVTAEPRWVAPLGISEAIRNHTSLAIAGARGTFPDQPRRR